MLTDIETTLNWLDAHFDLFLPPLDQAIFDRKLLQRTGELALLYRALRVSRLGSRDMLDRWHTSFIAYIESEELAEVSRKNLGSAWAWLMPYFVFKKLYGITVEEHEKTMRFSCASGYPSVSEVVPYRKMDQYYFLAMHTGSQFDVRNFIKDTALSSGINLLTIDREMAYSITHVLFYANDFGCKRMKIAHPANEKIVGIIDSLLPEFARKADWDVLGEVIILGLCTEGVDIDILSKYLKLFRNQRNVSGYTPPSDATKSVLNFDMDREKIFEACYHTTLVAAFVDASCVSNEKENVAEFSVSELSCINEEELLLKLMSARNKAVEYLNIASDKEVPTLPPIYPMNTDRIAASDNTSLAVLLNTREDILASLDFKSDMPVEISDQACSLAEVFARSGDIEVVLKLIGTCLGSQSITPRWAAILHFVLQSQKPDGSIGYFLQEARKLGANDISTIRISLTDTFVEALDSWLDASLEQAT